MRRNLTFVDYVRDRKQADVHVLGTRRPSGGGGAAYRLEFIGRKAFAGQRHELTYNARSTLTREELQQGLADRLRLGLVPFANRTPEVDYLEVTHDPPDEDDATSSLETDPWNQWVFDVGVSGSADVQAREHAYEIEGDLNAERITDEEVLLRRQERATNYEFSGSIGLSYTFGSIYNNVVNTRL